MIMTKSTHAIIANNVQRLMEYHDFMTQTALANKSGLSQRTVSNVLRPGSVGSVTMETIEALARFFDLEAYHLLIPDLPIEELLSDRIEAIIDCYAHAPIDGRENIRRIAENEVRYALPPSLKK